MMTHFALALYITTATLVTAAPTSTTSPSLSPSQTAGQDVQIWHVTSTPAPTHVDPGDLDVWVGMNGPVSVTYHIEGGVARAGRLYITFASTNGTIPGTPIEGTGLVLPLNVDGIWPFGLFNIAWANINTPAFTRYLGLLDANGDAYPQLNTPSLPFDPAYHEVHHAVIVIDLVTLQVEVSKNQCDTDFGFFYP